MSPIGLAVIGAGYWGPNLVRNFTEAAECVVAAVADMRPERRAAVQQRYPNVRTTADYHELIADPAIDAIAIATPVDTHFPLALEALRAGKHVWVEKPITTTSAEAMTLIEEAARRRLILHVDHTFIYTGAVRKIKELVSTVVGHVYYYDAVRVNLGLFQRDVNVLWDLAVHDLSILDHVLPMQPHAVSVTGACHVNGSPEDVAYLTLFFDNSTIAHVHVNWLAPVKVRRTLIGGSNKMIVYDDLEPSEKIKVYDKGLRLGDNTQDGRYQMLVGYRTGDMWAPQVDISEALLVEANHFADCIKKGQHTITDGEAGLRVVRILEAATASMGNRGRVVEFVPPMKVTA